MESKPKVTRKCPPASSTRRCTSMRIPGTVAQRWRAPRCWAASVDATMPSRPAGTCPDRREHSSSKRKRVTPIVAEPDRGPSRSRGRVHGVLSKGGGLVA